MSDILTQLYRACDPLRPATPEYYVDASEVRGDYALARKFLRELDKAEEFQKETGAPLRYLFSGHIGCGKSSELAHLRDTLRNKYTCPVGRRYFPVLLDAEDYLDRYDVTPTDILLSIVAELAHSFREELKIELKDSYFAKRFGDMRDLLFSDIGVKKTEIALGQVKAELQLLQKDADARQKVREQLFPQPSTLVQEINNVFDEARLRLKQKKAKGGEASYTDFVLILDNMEKIQQVKGFTEGEVSQRQLFLQSAPQFIDMRAHTVYTVPLPLVRSHGTELESVYGAGLMVLPMIKVETRKMHARHEAGYEMLRTMLQKRLGSQPLEDVFETEALNWLIRYSGGDMRMFMSFIRQATNEVDTPPITLRAARKAIGQTVSLFSTSIPSAHWPKLARLEQSPNQQIDNNDPDYRRMLSMLSVLEYRNGGNGEATFQEDAPWYAVHPIVRELSQFTLAMEQLIAEREAAERAAIAQRIVLPE